MTEILESWLDNFSPEAQAAIIAAVVGLVAGFVGPAVKHFWDRWSLRHRLRTEHEYSERKKLRELISAFHGRILEGAESLNHRLWNIRTNHRERWLELNGHYERVAQHYYFRTTIHRVLVFLRQLKEFQDQAIYIDARIAEKTDLLFLMYVKALEWALTDVALFDGLNYNPNNATDHLFKGHIRVACEACAGTDAKFTLYEFENCLRAGKLLNELRPLYRFFDGLSDNGRLRWDRLVAFHILLCSFINAFGYPMQRTSAKQLRDLASTLRHPEVLQNLMQWLKKLGIGSNRAGKKLTRTLKPVLTVIKKHPSTPAGEGTARDQIPEPQEQIPYT